MKTCNHPLKKKDEKDHFTLYYCQECDWYYTINEKTGEYVESYPNRWINPYADQPRP